jgi:hypothetical protein
MYKMQRNIYVRLMVHVPKLRDKNQLSIVLFCNLRNQAAEGAT